MKKKKRIIFVPQLNVNMRYQSWWNTEFEIQFKKYFDEVIVLGKEYLKDNKNKDIKDNNFSLVDESIELETIQINEYMRLELKEYDILFMSDLSFPGIFQNVLFHKKPFKSFAYCHATSLNYEDYYSKDREIKWPIENTIANALNGIFLGSKYNDRKTNFKTNTYVVSLPEPPLNKLLSIENHRYDDKFLINKINDIVSVCRKTNQKIDYDLEDIIKEKYNFIRKNDFSTWDDYFVFLNNSKILLITSKEDTFNYTIIDALLSDCIPVAPNKLCFPEILPKDYLYNDYNELEEIIDNILNNKLKIPKLKCQNNIDNFYKNICEIMLT